MRLRVLIVEDAEDDAKLLVRAMAKEGFEVAMRRVDTAPAMQAALKEGAWDVILSDHSMPEFSALAALGVLKESGSDLPFIIVSGLIGEEVAVEAMKAGAHDYIMKGNLARLVPAIERELREAVVRRERREAGEALRRAYAELERRVEERTAELATANQELRQSREWLRVTLTSIGDGVIAADANGRITFLNSVAATLTGWTLEDALGQPLNVVFQALNERTRETVGNVAARAMKEKRVLALANDTSLLTKDGREIPIEDSAAPILNAAGSVVGAVLVFHDVTERRRAQGALRESEERFRLLVEGVRDYAIFTLDPKGRITSWNAGAQRIKGWSADEVVGRYFSLFYPPDAIAKGRPEKELEEAATQGRYQEEGLRVRRDGSQFWADVLITGLYDEQGRVRGFAKVTRDITQRKAAAVERERLLADVQHRAAELTAVNKELESFAYSVSHDLRAPQRRVDGFSQALLGSYADKLDERGRHLLTLMGEESSRMGQLIDGMLVLSRTTRAEMRIGQVDLSALAAAIGQELRETQTERSVEFVVAQRISALGDERLLRVVLENLLGNAWKFTARHPTARIEFGVTEGEGERIYFVRDDGAGFDMAYADKLFAVFQRLHGDEEFSGTGVGLATVQRIVHRHGGRVWAEGAIDRGATFYFTLGQQGAL